MWIKTSLFTEVFSIILAPTDQEKQPAATDAIHFVTQFNSFPSIYILTS